MTRPPPAGARSGEAWLTVMERFDAETARRGLRIAHYELVGCAPAAALDERVRARLRDLRPAQRLDPRWF